jgi:leucyl-tRNA synthetase
MKQWMLKITEYAERLLQDLEFVNWPESTKEMQKNWIGKSEGARVVFNLTPALSKGEGMGDAFLEVFTTRPDTLWGATYMVLAPEHPLVDLITTAEYKTAVEIYKQAVKNKTDLERQQLEKEKTGVFTGGFAVNPVNDKEIPIWISDYVLMSYGTGAIMAVPGHDRRDWEFARKFHLPIVEVVKGGNITEEAFEGEGISVNSGFISGLKTEDAKKKVIDWLEENDLGQAAVQYKLRDWLFSRQRYWGEPIPVIHLEDGTVKPVDDNDLPVTLPEVESYKPTGTGESPLASIPEWVNTIDKETGKPAKRETNTMPQWAGSCWYYLRFLDPHNDKSIVSKEIEKYWMPVDFYLGGAEHAVLHLLYARFWHKVLYDEGYVSTPEPFIRLYHPGMILGVGEDSNKMSKSRGNVVNPDDVVAEYGADSLRLFEMFLGPLSATKPWSTRGIEGVFRFLNRVWRLFVAEDGKLNPAIEDAGPEKDIDVLINTTIRNIIFDIEDMDMKFNTCVSELMIFVNEISKYKKVPKSVMETFVKLLHPFAPHLAEELWQRLGHNNTIAYEPWPEYNPQKLIKSVVLVVGQVNGKIRAKLEVETDTDEETLKEIFRKDEKMKKYIDGRQIVKEIVVKNKLVNIVVK